MPDLQSSAQSPNHKLYLTHIRPLLQTRCTSCHGALRQESGLRLDTVAAMRIGGAGGPAFKAGDANASLILHRVSSTDAEHRMPPEGSGEPLQAEQQQLLKDWIAAGAPAPDNEQPDADPRDHWAFRPIVRPEIPPQPETAEPAASTPPNPIDLLLATHLRQQQLSPLPEAPREILLRRLSLDLIGLPPTPEELAADETHPNDLSRLRATGFLARNYFLFNRPQWMDETVEHVSKAFPGLTFNCARCHDHKYDPIDQTDYYRLRAFFEPYHARVDVVPGEADLERDGIPRVFDAHPDDPTWLYIRGDEKRPDKSQSISPGLPAIFA